MDSILNDYATSVTAFEKIKSVILDAKSRMESEEMAGVFDNLLEAVAIEGVEQISNVLKSSVTESLNTINTNSHE
jgi:hypothetical protein